MVESVRKGARKSPDAASKATPSKAAPASVVEGVPPAGSFSLSKQAIPVRRPLGHPNGMPSKVQAGAEALSGIAMDDVRVRRNSAEPAKLSALAFAKGNEIHLGPGQDSHLPHEAWHVVQQKQGRVPAMKRLNGVPLNDNATLEREADAMGARIAQTSNAASAEVRPSRSSIPGLHAVQRKASNVETDHGFFEAVQYEAFPTESPTDHIGAMMSLKFMAKPPVFGRVGLIQTVKHLETDSEKRFHPAKIDAARTLTAKARVGNSSNLDYQKRVVGQSPVYAAIRDPERDVADKERQLDISDSTNPKDVVGKWSTSAHVSSKEEVTPEATDKRMGGDTVSKSGERRLQSMLTSQTGYAPAPVSTQAPEPAILNDQPGFRADQPHARMKINWEAEAAAVMLDGASKGAYLGSIKWGWNYVPPTEGIGPATLFPEEIELVSQGSPSDDFKVAAEKWNADADTEVTDPQGKFSFIKTPTTDASSRTDSIEKQADPRLFQTCRTFLRAHGGKQAPADATVRAEARALANEIEKRFEANTVAAFCAQSLASIQKSLRAI
jgi:hypothetical protein